MYSLKAGTCIQLGQKEMLPRGLKQHAMPTSHMTTIKLKGWKGFYFKGETKIGTRPQYIMRTANYLKARSWKKESPLWEIKTPRLEPQQKVQNIYINTVCDTGTPTWIIKTVLGPVRLPQGSDRNKTSLGHFCDPGHTKDPTEKTTLLKVNL